MSEETKTPTITNPEWTGYVLGLLTEKEKFRDTERNVEYPKVDGMRRLARILVGKIVKENCDMLQTPNPENGFTATAKFEVVVKDAAGDLLSFSDVADVNAVNTKGIFLSHASPVAATKAEGRALRKLLGLNTLAAEEVMGTPELADTDLAKGQISIIQVMCHRNKIDIGKLLTYCKTSETTMTPEIGQKILKLLNEYVTGEKPVPDKIRM